MYFSEHVKKIEAMRMSILTWEKSFFLENIQIINKIFDSEHILFLPTENVLHSFSYNA